jgi:hypothetical protein
MADPPELPTFFRHRFAVFNVLPAVGGRIWGVWDLDGCVGEVHQQRGAWTAERRGAETLGPYDAWQDAVAGLLDSRADAYDG